jgi:hypothetical protein
LPFKIRHQMVANKSPGPCDKNPFHDVLLLFLLLLCGLRSKVLGKSFVLSMFTVLREAHINLSQAKRDGLGCFPFTQHLAPHRASL